MSRVVGRLLTVAVVVGLAAVLALAVARRMKPPPICTSDLKPDIALLGYRHLFAEPDGDVRHFDPTHPLKLRILGEEPFSWRVTLVNPTDAPPLTPTWRRKASALFYVVPSDKVPDDVSAVRIEGQHISGGCQVVQEWAVKHAQTSTTGPARTLPLTEDARPNLQAIVRDGAPADALDALHRLAQLDTVSATTAGRRAEAWLRAAEVARKRRAVSAAVRHMSSAAFFLQESRQFQRGLDLLRDAEALARAHGHYEGLMHIALYRGDIEEARHNLDATIAAYKKALQFADQNDQPRFRVFIELGLVESLQESGHHAEALQRLERIRDGLSDDGSDRTTTFFHAHLAWALMRAMESGAMPPDWGMVRSVSELALAGWTTHGDAQGISNETARLARLAFLQRDFDTLGRRLREFRTLDPVRRNRVTAFVTTLEGEYELAQGRPPAAERRFQAALAEALADTAGRPSDQSWAALDGLARTALATGRRQAALQYFADAVHHLRATALRAPLLGSRAELWLDRRRLFGAFVGLLIESGRLHEAFERAHDAVSFPLSVAAAEAQMRGIDADDRARWMAERDAYFQAREQCEQIAQQLGAVGAPGRSARLADLEACRGRAAAAFTRADAHLEEVLGAVTVGTIDAKTVAAGLGPKEALVLELDADGARRQFVVTQAGVQVAPSSRPILELPQLEAMDHVYLVVGQARDAEQLTAPSRRDGKVPLERFSVSLVPTAITLAPKATDIPARDLLVIDPQQDLRRARMLGEALQTALPDAQHRAGSAARRGAVLEALAEADRFVFIGHGQIDETDAWRSNLMLGDGALTVADVLARRPALRLAVLSACEAAGAPKKEGSPWVAIASAFVVAGTRSVLAPTRPVTPREAHRFVDAFLDEGGLDRPGPAYRAAALALRAQGDPGWAAFVLFGSP